MARRGESSRDFLVEIDQVGLEVLLSLGGCQIEGESFMVSYDARLFLGKPRALMFVHEIPLPGFISKHSEVLKQLQGIHLRNN